jgi:hypothetical protein
MIYLSDFNAINKTLTVQDQASSEAMEKKLCLDLIHHLHTRRWMSNGAPHSEKPIYTLKPERRLARTLS